MVAGRTHPQFTPGRYFATGCIAVLLFTVLFLCQILVVDLAESGPTQALRNAVQLAPIACVVAAIAASIAAVFPGIPLTLAAHVFLRRTNRELVHVLVFALLGFLTAELTLWWLGPKWSGPLVSTLPLWTAAATGAARWIVGRYSSTRARNIFEPDPQP